VSAIVREPAPARGRFRALLPWPVRTALRLGALVAVVEFILLPQIAGSRASFHLLLHIDSPWIALAAAAEFGSLLAFALGTRAMLPSQHRPTVWRVFRIDLTTIALSHCVPAGGVAGTGLGLRMLRQAGVPVADAAFGKVAQGVGSVLVLLMLLWTALAVAIPLHGSNPIYLSVTAAGLVVFVVASLLLLLLGRGRPTAARWLGRITTALPRVDDGAGERFVETVGAQFDVVVADPRRLAAAVAFATANWLLDATALWASVRVFGHSLGYVGLMVPYALGQAAGWVPITPGGLGLVEGILVPTIVGFGSPRSVAILGVVLWRLLSFWLPIPVGAATYGSLVHTHHREAAPPVPPSREPAVIG
jgi:uncharacterized protein (TIRG00374 family)